MEHTNLTRRVASGLTAALLATGALTGVAVAAAPPAQASAPAASGAQRSVILSFARPAAQKYRARCLCVLKYLLFQLVKRVEFLFPAQIFYKGYRYVSAIQIPVKIYNPCLRKRPVRADRRPYPNIRNPEF